MPAEAMRAPTSELPIVFDRITLRAGDATLLAGVSLQIDAGAPTVILGPNGAGKTTLLRVAMGLDAPSEGRVTWGGRGNGPGRRAILFQRPVMLRRSAAANIAFALPNLPRRERAQRVHDLLARVSLDHLARRAAPRLSGGERQRLALARALAAEPQVLFLDEPASSLDPSSMKAVEAIVEDAARSGIKVVLTTHHLGQARRLAGDVVFMARGRVVERAPAKEFFDAPKTPEAAAFLRGELVL